jgi:hypothetical protein
MNYRELAALERAKLIDEFGGDRKEELNRMILKIQRLKQQEYIKEISQDCHKVIDKLMFRLQMSDMDYFKKSTRRVIEDACDVIYSIAMEEGVKQRAKAQMKPVIARKDGVEKLFNGLREAASKIDRRPYMIRNAIKSGGKCAGFHWKYA